MTMAPPIKILWALSSFGRDPAARRVAAVIARLRRGYAHVLCAMDGDYTSEASTPLGARYRRLDIISERRGAFATLGALWRIRRALKSEKPDIVVTCNYGALEWLVVNRGGGAAPHVHIEDPSGLDDAFDLDAAGGGSTKESRRAWTRRRAFPGRNRVFIALTEELARSFTELWGAPADAVKRIPIGLDPGAPAKAATSRDGRAEDDPVILASYGPLAPGGRLERVIRLAATLRERGRAVALRLFGEGPDRARLELLAERLGLGAQLVVKPAPSVDAMGPDARAAAMAGVDIYVEARDRMRSPTGVAAAMAAARPVVGVDTGELRAMVSEENRLFIRPAADAGALAAAAELLVVDPEARARIGRANRAQVEAASSIAAMSAAFDALFCALARPNDTPLLPPPGPTSPPPTAHEAASDTTGRDPNHDVNRGPPSAPA